MNEYVIDIHHLTKKFDQRIVVDNLSLQVQRGAIFGFLGANGSGKTTTIRMLCGLLKPTSGSGHCLGYDILKQSAEIKQRMGYLPQQFSFYTGLTVQENLRFVADIYQVLDYQKRIEEMIQDLALTPYLHIKASSLSGGWKQRLALACCLLHKPQLLFLDEPTAGVDPKARKDFWDYLHTISLRDGITVLITTHYMDEAEKCNQLAYIYQGELLYSGNHKDLMTFSHVKTYLCEKGSVDQSLLFDQIKKQYPQILVSFVNNDLRISSKNSSMLEQCIYEQTSEQKSCVFKEVTPNFEEIFIELIPT